MDIELLNKKNRLATQINYIAAGLLDNDIVVWDNEYGEWIIFIEVYSKHGKQFWRSQMIDSLDDNIHRTIEDRELSSLPDAIVVYGQVEMNWDL